MGRLKPGLRRTCIACPFPATTQVRQYRLTLLQKLLRRPPRTAVACPEHIWHAIRYCRTGERLLAPIAVDPRRRPPRNEE